MRPALALVFILTSCASANIKYERWNKCELQPSESIQAVRGKLGQFEKEAQKATLPHAKETEKYASWVRAARELTTQLGSNDYWIVGHISAGGNAFTSPKELQKRICERAKSEGGQVVLIYKEGVNEVQNTYTTPGYSTTHVSGNAYGSGTADSYGNTYTYNNQATGSATATTTYTPSQTHTDTYRYPFVSGFVLRHLAGLDSHQDQVMALPEEYFEEYVKRIGTDGTDEDESAMWTRMRDTLMAVVASTESAPESQAKTSKVKFYGSK